MFPGKHENHNARLRAVTAVGEIHEVSQLIVYFVTPVNNPAFELAEFFRQLGEFFSAQC